MTRLLLGLLVGAALAGCSPKKDNRPSRIAFVIDRAGTRSDILLVDPEGGDPTPVAEAEAEDESPAWSPDGLSLIFTSKRNGHFGMYFWEGEKLRLLSGANYKDLAPSWSPSGRRIAYMSNRDNTWQIYSISANGRDEKRLTNSTSNDTRPTWSPDGKSILFQSDRGGQQDLYQMKVLPAEAEPNPKPGPKGEPPPEVKVTEEATAVTNDRAWDGRPAWSPDGARIAWASQRDGKSAVFILTLATKQVTRLTPLSSEADEPTWSPDGKRIAFVSTRDGFREIYVQDADGKGAARRVTFLKGQIHTPSWSPFLPQ